MVLGLLLFVRPLTNAVMDAAPAAQSGVASALINASREVAGLLGVTVIGAVLRTVQASSLRGGSSAHGAFLNGYHAGLWVTIGMVAAGVVLSYVTLRQGRSAALPDVADMAQSVGSSRAVPELLTEE
jgi:hypothetical protein